MDTAMFCFPVDLADRIDSVLDDVRSAGVGGVALAAAYHTARDYLPHHPTRRIHYTPPGISFHPELTRYPAQLRPHPLLPVCRGRDMLAELVDAASRLHMAVDAWTVYLHRDTEAGLAGEHDGHVRNAFGDVYPVALCPASPVTVQHATALTADVCARRPRSIIAEALHYLPLDHGYHHERSFACLGGLAKLLLSLCFCEPCREAGRDAGLDVPAIASWVRQTVDAPTPATIPTPTDRAALCRQADTALGAGVLDGFFGLREQHVHNLVAACQSVARKAAIRFRFLDVSVALIEETAVDPTSDVSWQLGVSLAQQARAGEVVSTLYVRDARRLQVHLDALTARLGRPPDGAVLRPMPVDCPQPTSLRDKVDALRAHNVSSVSYYHYGLMERRVLDEIRDVNK